MFGSSGLDFIDMDEKSYEFSFSNPSDSSSSSYLNSYFEDEIDVKPLLDYPFTDTYFDNQTSETLLSQASEFFIQQKVEDYMGSYEMVVGEIREVLKAVCETHCLPMAQTWSLCGQQGQRECHQQSSACISVISSASYVFDSNVLGFYEACSDLHLLKGEGIAGKALSTNQPCFATDVTAFSTTEYPLSDAARVSGLGGAVAIRLRSTYLGPIDFILEFFLPSNCRDDEEQKSMLSSISSVIQRVSRSLRVVNDDELAEEDESSCSWISKAQKRGESFIVSFKEEPREEFQMVNQWDYTKQNEQKSKPKGRKRSLGIRKSEEKRRVKPEKIISLPVLQQYFPGSLKDAAKSIGVCPTTLKRICREHGIMRWPSRKIKKVGHSLKKLQVVIDSVQGVEGTIKLGSFYTNFPELTSSKLLSHSSSCGSPNSLQDERKSTKRARKEKLLDYDHSNENAFRVKAVYGEMKIRLSVLKDCGFWDLKREVMRRFGIMGDANCVTLKYLDDDLEWVLLTCDADLEECMDINMVSKKCSIKVLVNESFHPESGSSFTGNGLAY